MNGFPQWKLLVMAALDTIQFAGLTISAAGVSPTMTVILLHTSTPFVVLISKYSFPDRTYTTRHIQGAQLIAIAVLLSLIGSFCHVFFSGQHQSDISSSIIYVIMAAFHGFATLFKEKSISLWAQPIDIYYLSAWIFMYQLLFSILLIPILYYSQGTNYEP